LTPDYAMSAANTPYLGRRPPYRSLEEAGRLERIQRAFLCDQEGQQREAISAVGSLFTDRRMS
jgi:hypothetical protein